ncbi:hypothetical protein N9991_00080 [bacterium]|nr:hypothetical protein [bacterium]
MSQLFVDNIKNRTGGAIGAPSGAVVTGVVTATSFVGSGVALTGIDATALKDSGGSVKVQANASGIVVTGVSTFSGNVSVGGTLTYEDVTNIDSVGVVTARQGIRIGAGQSIGSDGAAVVYYGNGSNLEGVVSGVELKQAGSSVGTSLTAINFASGATLTTGSAGVSTITIAAGINTTASSPSANTVVTLNLSTAQHHDLTLTAGITTITCSGGVFGESHSVVISQPSSGIATVGFSTFFLFPSGATPNMSEGGSKVDLVSFVVKRVGAGGIQLLASAGLNYSN